jgi:hypothetical protein
MTMNLFAISRIFITPYFSLIMIVCGLLLYMVCRSDGLNNFPTERKVAKWGALLYLALSIASFIFNRFAG